MTKKRDLKRRVRERQEKTGESYVTARRHVVAAAPDEPDVDDAGEPADDAPSQSAVPAGIPFVELVDLSAEAARLGMRCEVRMTPLLAEQTAAMAVLERLRELLVATADDPETELLRTVVLRTPGGSAESIAGVRPPRQPSVKSFESLRRFIQRARAGLGGTSDDGTRLAYSVAGDRGLVHVLCTLWYRGRVQGPPEPSGLVLSTVAEELGTPRLLVPTLFLEFEGRRRAVVKDPFVIGRQKTADLQIRDGLISRRHAAVIRHGTAFYIKDLGSTAGIVYKGMRIDNKRIDEADVFSLASYELRFTFSATG